MTSNWTNKNGKFWKPGTTFSNQSSSILIDDSNKGTGDDCGAIFNFRTDPLSLQRQMLPIHKYRRQILYAMENFSVIIVVGETG